MALLRKKAGSALALLVVGACASGEAIEAASGQLDGGAGVSGTSASGASGGDSGSSAAGGASSGGSAGKWPSGGSSGSGGSMPSDGGGTGASSGGWPTGGTGGGDSSGGSGGSATGGTGGGGTTGGSGGTSGCTPPLVDCGGTCVDTSTNPQHCSACNNVCASPNATASCSGGVCSYACNAGFLQVGSKCATFGGAFAGPGPGCAAAGCYTDNPYSAGCSCPANFPAPIGPIDMLDDRTCPNNNPPVGWQSARVCVGGAWSATADFGGAYHRQGPTCFDGNPFTGGLCSCPAPSIAIEMIADGSCWNDTHFGMCWNPSATLATFGGAYQKSDNAACVVGNPATGGACSCPAGTTEISIRNIYGPGNAGCEANGAVGGHIYICRAL